MTQNWYLYHESKRTDAAYQVELIRCYGHLNAGTMRYRTDDHPDAQCQAARVAYRAAIDAFRAQVHSMRKENDARVREST